MTTRRTGESWFEDLLEVGHTLGAAAWFGGQLFATVGLHPAVEVLSDPTERTKVIDEAWRRFRPYANAGLALAGLSSATWALRPVDQPPPELAGLGNFNLACTAGTLAAAAASGYFGKKIADATPQARTPIATATRPAGETPAQVAQAQTWLAVSEALALAFGIGLLVSSALLSKQTRGEEQRRGEGQTWGDRLGRGAQPGLPTRLAG